MWRPGQDVASKFPYTVGFLVESQCMWVRVGGGWRGCAYGARRHNNSTSWEQQQHLIRTTTAPHQDYNSISLNAANSDEMQRADCP